MSASEIYYDPYDYEIDANPHPVWRRMRDEAPLYRNERYGFWALSRFNDVYDASIDHETFSSAHTTVLELMDKPLEFAPMIFLDPPEHDQLRKLVGKAFTPRRIAQLEDRIRALCVGYLEPRVGSGGFDYIREFGARLPVMVISSLLGIPEADQEAVRKWTDATLHRDEGSVHLSAEGKRAQLELHGYFHDQIEARRKSPRDDMISDLLRAQMVLDDGRTRQLDDMELHGFFALLSAAGNETVARLLGWAAVTLARHPDQRRKLVNEPRLIPGAVEELLRYEAPSPVQARWVTRDVEYYGTVVPKDSKMLLLTGSAGRDEREYPDADRFDVERKIARHVSFGYGIHFCLGASLARMEGRIALEETLARFPAFEVVEDALEMVHTSTVRGYESVPIRL